MKQKQRHQLKENELVHSIVTAREYLETHRRSLTMGLLVLVVALAGALGYMVVRQRTEARAHNLLAEAMVIVDAPVQAPSPAAPAADGKPATPAAQAPGTYPTGQAKLTAALPKLRAVADTYPDADAGITARYHLAASLAALGRHEEALAAYDDVVKHAGNSIYARMARLGRANEQARLGRFDPAISTYKELADSKESDIPADAILMQLARTYEASGNREEAKKAFSRIVHEHPASPYSAEAGKQLQ